MPYIFWAVSGAAVGYAFVAAASFVFGAGYEKVFSLMGYPLLVGASTGSALTPILIYYAKYIKPKTMGRDSFAGRLTAWGNIRLWQIVLGMMIFLLFPIWVPLLGLAAWAGMPLFLVWTVPVTLVTSLVLGAFMMFETSNNLSRHRRLQKTTSHTSDECEGDFLEELANDENLS